MFLTHILILVIVLNRGISIVYHHKISRQTKLLGTLVAKHIQLTHITVYMKFHGNSPSFALSPD